MSWELIRLAAAATEYAEERKWLEAGGAIPMIADIQKQYDCILDRLDPDKENALEYLIDLYRIAVKFFEHGIVDSIALSVCDRGDEKTCQYLKVKMAETSDPPIRKAFDAWIDENGGRVQVALFR